MTHARFRATVLIVAAMLIAVSTRNPLVASTLFLSDLTWVSTVNGWGPVERDRTNGDTGTLDGGPIRIDGVTYAKGVGVHAGSDVRFTVPPTCTAFTAVVGIDDDAGDNGSVIFEVIADGVTLFNSGIVTGGSAAQNVSVSVAGRSQLALIASGGADGIDYDHADWADARFTCEDAAALYGTATAYPTGANSHGVEARDVNGDGSLDLIVANAGASTVSVLIGTGTGTFATAVDYGVGAYPKHVTVADFNADSLPDLVTSDQDGSTVTVLLGETGGTFGAATSFPVCSRAHESAAADFNGDGRMDLGVACWDGAVISVLLGTGTGTFQPAISYTVGYGPTSLVATDVNGDGWPDIVTSNNVDNTISVLIGSGTGTFAPAVTYASGNGPHGIRLRDLNGDGALDIVNANANAADVSVFLGNGDGTFQPRTLYPAGVAPTGIGLEDVDGDGAIDIVATNTGGNYPVCCNPGGDRIAVLRGAGNGTFSVPEFFAVGTTPFAVAIGDLNGDGQPDLATANWHSNDVTVLLRTDTTPSSVIHLSDLAWTAVTNGWGPVELDRSNADFAAGDGLPLRIAGVTYTRGLGVHAASEIRYAIPSGCTTFHAVVGVDDEVGAGGSVVHEVWVDGIKVFDSGVVFGNSEALTVDVDVTGRALLQLVVTDGGDGIDSDHADWADASLTCGGRR